MNLNEFRKSVEYAKDDEIGSNLLTMTYYQANELLALLDQQAAALALAREREKLLQAAGITLITEISVWGIKTAGQTLPTAISDAIFNYEISTR